MEWDSPWGKGFPGWHIECSAMSMKYLGETLDIHSGGIDHIPVHHTNEIAQSEAATGKRFANLWFHSNHVTINGEKISKSLGNGIRLQEVTAKGIAPEALRLHILESHYRSQSRFSWKSLLAAQNRIRHWQAVAVLRYQANGSGELAQHEVIERIKAALVDDLNTPKALQIIDELLSHIESHPLNHIDPRALEELLTYIDSWSGLNLIDTQDLSVKQKQLIAERETARTAKDWTKSDELRDELKAQGIGLRDTDQGAIWFRL
jgi:cysteinyl-tRNA synthetase